MAEKASSKMQSISEMPEPGIFARVRYMAALLNTFRQCSRESQQQAAIDIRKV
ncbi:hypothetical protein FC17_GL001095 [Secundilactobacillus paracollinoides DSM 15502 = JCM 11969]|nr:hypothetical protein FC17_GL001095 [Secundilactobacillus paracollinoides DSM 15502 = JCM 11969]